MKNCCIGLPYLKMSAENQHQNSKLISICNSVLMSLKLKKGECHAML